MVDPQGLPLLKKDVTNLTALELLGASSIAPPNSGKSVSSALSEAAKRCSKSTGAQTTGNIMATTAPVLATQAEVEIAERVLADLRKLTTMEELAKESEEKHGSKDKLLEQCRLEGMPFAFGISGKASSRAYEAQDAKATAVMTLWMETLFGTEAFEFASNLLPEDDRVYRVRAHHKKQISKLQITSLLTIPSLAHRTCPQTVNPDQKMCFTSGTAISRGGILDGGWENAKVDDAKEAGGGAAVINNALNEKLRERKEADGIKALSLSSEQSFDLLCEQSGRSMDPCVRACSRHIPARYKHTRRHARSSPRAPLASSPAADRHCDGSCYVDPDRPNVGLACTMMRSAGGGGALNVLGKPIDPQDTKKPTQLEFMRTFTINDAAQLSAALKAGKRRRDEGAAADDAAPPKRFHAMTVPADPKAGKRRRDEGAAADDAPPPKRFHAVTVPADPKGVLSVFRASNQVHGPERAIHRQVGIKYPTQTVMRPLRAIYKALPSIRGVHDRGLAMKLIDPLLGCSVTEKKSLRKQGDYKKSKTHHDGTKRYNVEHDLLMLQKKKTELLKSLIDVGKQQPGSQSDKAAAIMAFMIMEGGKQSILRALALRLIKAKTHKRSDFKCIADGVFDMRLG